jgi:UDP-glucuronate 4-epimerase
MRALVTGAAGFIGSTLSGRLLAEGHSVVGIDALTDYYDPALKRANLEVVTAAGLQLVEADINEADLDAVLEGVDVVFHLAGQPGVRASWGRSFEIYLDQNILATQRLLEAAKDLPLKKFVYASSSSIYGDAERFPTKEEDLPRPISPYGVSKLAGEHLCRLYFRASEVPTVSLRYFTIYGPRQRPDMAFNRFIGMISRGDPVTIFGDGEQVRDFTYVDDVVAANIAAAERGTPGAVYNIAGGSQTTVNEVLETIGELVGKPVEIERLEPMQGDARRTGADTTRAREELRYSPAIGLRAGLERQVAHARDNG